MTPTPLNRCDALWNISGGFAGIALSALLHRDGLLADTATPQFPLGSDGVLKAFHYPPKAKRVVQLFMAGAASHIDLFDYKPDLAKYHGQPSNFGEHVEAFQNG